MDRLIYHIAGKDSTGTKKDIFKAGFNASDEPLVSVGTTEVNLVNTMVAPEGGTAGQVLTKTSTGYGWENNSPVEANPALEGSEAQLNSIKIGNTKYNTSWSKVEANPTLAGTESQLNSIKINDISYEIGGKVDDVKINGTSVLTDKVANIPIASTSLGVVQGIAKTDETSQVAVDANGKLWYKDEKGATVIANPTLSGTEAALTGLTVGTTSYKVEGSVTDVKVDGSSVVTSGIANITSPTVPVTDVKVNGTSVLSNKVANITITDPVYPVTDVTMDGTSVLNNKIAVLTTDAALTSAKNTNGIGYRIGALNLTWDGNTEGKSTVQTAKYRWLTKISDEYVSSTNFLNSATCLYTGAGSEPIAVTAITTMTDGNYRHPDGYFFIIQTECTYTDSYTVTLTPGIWFKKVGGEDTFYTSVLTSQGSAHKIDSTYISSPENYSNCVLTSDGRGNSIWEGINLSELMLVDQTTSKKYTLIINNGLLGISEVTK